MKIRRFFTIAIFLVAAALVVSAQQGNIPIKVSPEEAYIFVDGRPLDHRTTTVTLTPGEHVVGIYNYGFVPEIHKIYVEKGFNPTIEARLKPVTGMVNGPWGRIQIEQTPDDNAAVFLNGRGPEFFVGHVDEMNNDIVAKQQLIVPPGMHELIIVSDKDNKEIWSGPVEVTENTRVIVNTSDGSKIYKPWPEGKNIHSLKRFEAGTATATIAVAPVTGKFSVDREHIKCGEAVELSWNTSEAALTTITANGEPLKTVPLSGELNVQPMQTTRYEFRTSGPGGVVTSTKTVTVDNSIHAFLTATPAELTYRRVGDKVIEQGQTTLQWSAPNADAVHIDNIGLVTGTSGSEPLKAIPRKSGAGPVDEVQTYTIRATNACGGSDTETASVHVTGSIEPEQVAEVKEPELPQTASPLPLIGLLGFASIGSGLLLKRFRKH